MKDKMKFNESCRCQEQNSESYKSVGKSHFHSSLACDLIPRTSVSKQNQSRTWSQQHKEPRRRHAKRQTTPLIPVYWQVGIHIPKLSLPFFLLLGKSRRNFPYGTQSLKGYMSWFCSPCMAFQLLRSCQRCELATGWVCVPDSRLLSWVKQTGSFSDQLSGNPLAPAPSTLLAQSSLLETLMLK